MGELLYCPICQSAIKTKLFAPDVAYCYLCHMYFTPDPLITTNDDGSEEAYG